MKDKLEREKHNLIELLKQCLTGEKAHLVQADWGSVIHLARRHAVLSLLYEVLKEEKQQFPRELWKQVEVASRQVVQSSYRLLFLSAHLIKLFKEAGIEAALLKGAGTASLYPYPELRKSGDVDLLLLDSQRREAAHRILSKEGFQKMKEQHSNHHQSYIGPEGITVELHEELTETLDSREANEYLQKVMKECREHICSCESMGVMLPILDTPYHGFYLLLHMLHHFLQSGFGLKLLCDWVMFWNREIEEKEKEAFFHLVEGCGLLGFAGMITAVCIRYLNLKGEGMDFLPWRELRESTLEEFLEEILEAEEFGHSQSDRLVMVRGRGLWNYFREFHHQMHVNYKKAGKIPVLWPILWLMTFCVFVYNNRRIRKVSGREILKKAGKRSRLMKEIHLFQKVKEGKAGRSI